MRMGNMVAVHLNTPPPMIIALCGGKTWNSSYRRKRSCGVVFTFSAIPQMCMDLLFERKKGRGKWLSNPYEVSYG